MEPITRKELFMAKAAGQNVNVPKPITREEKYLKHMADNSVSKYFGESTEVLFDQRVEFVDADGMRVFSSQFSEALESDKTHTVTYNGVSYDCVPYDVYSDGSALFIGNKALFGQDDTGEPFAIMVSSLENGSKFQLDIISVNGDTSATVKIEKSVIHTIDPKFLPTDYLKQLFAEVAGK